MNGIIYIKYGVNVPKSTPLTREEIDGMNTSEKTFLIPNLEIESIRRKLITLPINSCGCLNKKGTRNAVKYIREI